MNVDFFQDQVSKQASEKDLIMYHVSFLIHLSKKGIIEYLCVN